LGCVAGDGVGRPLERLPELEGSVASRVLVVDEHPATRQGIVEGLRELGFRADEADSAQEALETLAAAQGSEDPYLAVIGDYQLPDLDGLSFAHEAHMRPGLERLKVLLMAPVGQRLDPGLLRTVGVAGSLMRPVRMARLGELMGQILRGEDALASAEERTVQAPSGAPVLDRPLRLLMAEDNLVNQKVAVTLLGKLGYQADIVTNGRAVLQAVHAEPYDVILMDCQMPELDGYETTRELRRREAAGEFGRHQPHVVIALTANAMSGDRERCLAAGMDDFLTKPLNEEGLRRALAQASLRKAGMALRLEAQPASTASTGGDVPTLNPSVLGVFRGLRVPSGPDPLAELVDLFLSDLPQRLAEISGAARAGDAAALKAAAHTLKGSANNLGGLRMAALCAQLEGAGTDAQRVTGLLRELSEEAERLRVALEAEKAL